MISELNSPQPRRKSVATMTVVERENMEPKRIALEFVNNNASGTATIPDVFPMGNRAGNHAPNRTHQIMILPKSRRDEGTWLAKHSIAPSIPVAPARRNI